MYEPEVHVRYIKQPLLSHTHLIVIPRMNILVQWFNLRPREVTCPFSFHKLNCFHTLNAPLLLLLQMIYLRRQIWSGNFKAVPFEGVPAVLPKSQLFRKTPASMTMAQEFHSSCCSWKKKKPPEPAPRELDLLRYDMKSLKDSPKPALYLGFATLIPFVSVPLLMAIQEVSYPELVFAQIAYGAAVVSFLGGIRWGFALPEGSPAKPDWINLANSIVPLVTAWIAMLLKDDLTQAGTMVIMGLGIALHYDLALLPTYPSWFKALRTIVTIVAASSLIASLLIMNNYPEKHLHDKAIEVELSK